MPDVNAPRPTPVRPLAAEPHRAAVRAACLAIAVAAGGVPAARAQNGPAPAQRQSPVPGPSGASETVPSGPSPGEPGFTTQLFGSSRSTLLGDAYGLRTFLGRYGVSLGLSEASEVFGNATGGTHRGAAYDGLTQFGLGIDTEKAFGWEGGTFNVSAFQIHGRNLSTDNLQSLNTNSGIQANRATRLWELWYQQALLSGRVDVKVGQQSLDQEFIISAGASTFINTEFGWPAIPSYDQYAGGPAYPLSSLGVRVRAQPIRNVSVLAGVFDDNPPGGSFFDDGQNRGAEKSGTKFNLRTGALFFGEVQYGLNQPSEGQLVPASGSSGLAGTYKLGAWYDTARFFDQRFDTNGLSLADPNSNGLPKLRRHDFSIYLTADQVVWHPAPDEPLALSVFLRAMGAPGDRNLVDIGLNAGVTVKAPFPGRDNDTFGVAWAFAKVGYNASQLGKDTAFFSQAPNPVRSSESTIEVTYQYSVAPWWAVQPDVQYTWLPGGGIANPLAPGKRIGNEAVFGVRTNITF